MKTKLGFLANLTKNSFNSLGYEDWSTPQQRVAKTTKKSLSKNENKVEDKTLITTQRINHEIHT